MNSKNGHKDSNKASTARDAPAIDTFLQHVGLAPFDSQSGSAPVALPPYRTSTVRFSSMAALDNAMAARQRGERVASYGRTGLATHAALEELLCRLEDGERAFLAPSGMAAITLVLLALLNQGDHALVVDSVYQPVRRLQSSVLARMGVSMDFVAPDIAALQAALRPDTRVLYLESPGSLLLQMQDLPALAAWAHAQGLLVVADNTWGSAYIYRPLLLGADISVLAATKYLGGHSDLMLGAAVARGADLIRRLDETHYALGTAVSADDVWLSLRGARTLGLRMQACGANALQLCQWLAEQPWVMQVFHPAWPEDSGHELWRRDASGSNGMLAIALDMSLDRARRMIDKMQLFGLGYSWGGYESLVTLAGPEALSRHSYWQAQEQICQRQAPVMRLHAGLESVDDLIADLHQAYQASA